MMIGATLKKKGVVELHKLLRRCRDHPALVLEPVVPLVVVPDGDKTVDESSADRGRTVDGSTSVEMMSVELGMVTELIKRDLTVGASVALVMESDAADDDEVSGPEEIPVMEKVGLASPESPNTGNILL